ncbi:MAG: hypothetical protein ACPMAG_00740 [Limisphaerales bacterium]|jgi:hypothetical protein
MIRRKECWGIFVGFGMILLGVSLNGADKALLEIDFKNPEVIKQWHPLHHISSFESTPDGLKVGVAGEDPYFASPAYNLPQDKRLWLAARLKSEKGGMGQIFYFRNNASEENSVRFYIKPGVWQEIEVPLPKLGAGYRFRIDPPGDSGIFIIDKISIEPRVEFVFPKWKYEPFSTAVRESVSAGKLTLHFNEKNPAAYEIKYDGKTVARSIIPMRIGYLYNKELQWMELTSENATIRQGKNDVSVLLVSRDKNAGQWKINLNFRRYDDGVIEMVTDVEVGQEREVMFLPLHLFSVGQPNVGTNKTQGLFAGLEYLENEPSSSEADIVGPESARRTPSPHKVTFPLMSIVQNGIYIGFIWEKHLEFAPIFDSPDRTFNTGCHIMGLLYPGWQDVRRTEGEILPEKGMRLMPGKRVTSRSYIIGGVGNTVVSSVVQYVKMKGLPPLPDTGVSFLDYVQLASYGWLKSKCREKNLYRHAYWQGFGLMPAADAAVYQDWLAAYAPQSLAVELESAAKEAISAVQPANYFNSGVGHVRVPAAPLIFDYINLAIKTAAQVARQHLSRFNKEGIVVYKPGNVDYGKTHYTNHANGLTSHAVVTAIEAAAFSGDDELIKAALERLRGLEIYKYGVPRGAQTWEVPLHTPDILASAHLVKAYVIGYQLSQDKLFLERARYWAWTGVPFVYLVNPTYEKVGPYSTIAVFGATSWKAPVWMGLPVQWCGLVYADALYELAEIDPQGGAIWQKLADGITAAGIQHTWKTDDPERGGLLPDSYVLKQQKSDGPAINPGTLQINAVRYYRKPQVYDCKVAVASKLIVHSPGNIKIKESKPGNTKFIIETWSRKPYFALINNVSSEPIVNVNGVQVKPTVNPQTPPGAQILGKNLILLLNGNANIEIRTQ